METIFGIGQALSDLNIGYGKFVTKVLNVQVQLDRLRTIIISYLHFRFYP